MGFGVSRATLYTTKKGRKGCFLYVFISLLIIAAISAVNMVYNSHVILNEQKITIAALPESLENFRILHISDLHASRFGDGQKNLYTTIKNIKYDVVCITGDMVGKSGDAKPFIELIELIPKDKPIYFINGDDDPEAILYTAHGSTSVYAEYIRLAEEHGAIYLDKPNKTTKGKAAIWFIQESIIGIDLQSAKSSLMKELQLLNSLDPYNPDTAARIRADQYRLDLLDKVEAAQSDMKDGEIQIVLSHQPLNNAMIRTLQQWADIGSKDLLRNISLILSGHYNNGQVRLPFLGAIYVPASSGLGSHGWFPDNSLVSGLSGVMGIAQYINPGLGVSGAYPYIPVRLFNSPSITLIELTAKITDTGA